MHENYETRVISDRKAEMRDWRMKLWTKGDDVLCMPDDVCGKRAVAPLCFAEKWYRQPEDRSFVKVESSGMLVVETPVRGQKYTLEQDERRRVAKEINQAPLWARAAALYTWTDWNWNTEVVDHSLSRSEYYEDLPGRSESWEFLSV